MGPAHTSTLLPSDGLLPQRLAGLMCTGGKTPLARRPAPRFGSRSGFIVRVPAVDRMELVLAD